MQLNVIIGTPSFGVSVSAAASLSARAPPPLGGTSIPVDAPSSQRSVASEGASNGASSSATAPSATFSPPYTQSIPCDGTAQFTLQGYAPNEAADGYYVSLAPDSVSPSLNSSALSAATFTLDQQYGECRLVSEDGQFQDDPCASKLAIDVGARKLYLLNMVLLVWRVSGLKTCLGSSQCFDMLGTFQNPIERRHADFDIIQHTRSTSFPTASVAIRPNSQLLFAA